MSNSFVKNHHYLKETHQVKDLLDFTPISSKCLNELRNIRHSSLYAVFGAYGSGKGTMLHQLASKPEQNTFWFQFDAWKFPERKHLWEGFVLEFVRQCDPALFEKVRRNIDGEHNKDWRALISVIARGANHFLTGLGFLENFNMLFNTSPSKINIINFLIKFKCKLINMMDCSISIL